MGRIPQGIGGIGVSIKQAAVEEILLDMIGVTEAEFRITTQRIVDLCGTSRGIGAGDIVIDALENMLGVPNNKFESFAGCPLPNDVPVMLRPIQIPNPMVDDH